MSTSTAELTLILRAQNLVSGAMTEAGNAIDGIKTKAGQLADAFKSAIPTMGTGLRIFIDDIARGTTWQQAGLDAGLFLGGTIVETMGATLIAKIAASSFIASLGAQLTVLGTAMGTIIDAAIGIAMIALPGVLIGALIAAVVVLVTNEDVRNKVIDVGKGIIKWLVDGLVGLGQALLNAVSKIPGAIADMIRQIKIDIGPFHLSAAGFVIDLPNLTQSAEMAGLTYAQAHGYTQHAEGGWAGLNGPEFSLLGESGPEYVIPNDQLRSMAAPQDAAPHVIQLVVDGRTLAEVVDEHQYRNAQRTPART